MVGRDNVTFRFRIDSAKAAAAIRQLEALLKKLGATAVQTGNNVNVLQTKTTNLGQQTAASAINFQTATQGMLNLSTAAVQTFTSISNLDRANNRAKQSIIAVARAEDLLNNKVQRRNEMQDAGISGGMKYSNILREIATAEADLIVKTEKRGIEQAAVNDIYMLFATNIANVTISSMQTIVILLGHDKAARLASVAAMRLQAFAFKDTTRVMIGHNIATRQATFALSGYSLATFKATLATKGLSLAVKGLMVAAWPLLAVTVALTAAWAIHESDILKSKTALNKMMGVEKDFQSVVDDGRNGIGEYDDALGGLGSTLDSSLPKSFEEATKIVIRFNQVMSESKVVADEASISIDKYHGSVASGQRGDPFIPSVLRPDPIKPQVQQGRGPTTRRFTTTAEEKKTKNLPFAQAIIGALSFDPTAGFMAFAELPEEPIEEPKEVKTFRIREEFKSLAQKLGKPVEDLTPEDIPTGFRFTFGELTDISTLGRSPVTDLPDIEQLAKELGMPYERVLNFIQKEGVSASKLKAAFAIKGGDFLSILEAQRLEKAKKFKVMGAFTPDEFFRLQQDQRDLREAKRIDENFAEEFRKKFTGVEGISIDKLLLEMGKLEPERKKRLTKETIFFPGTGFISKKDIPKVFAAKALKKLPTDPLAFGDINLKGMETEIDSTQYLQFLAAQKGVGGSFTLNAQEQKILDKIQSGEIKGNRAVVAITQGIDIGNFANSVSEKEALRIGALESTLGQFNFREGQFVKDTTPAFLKFFKSSKVEGKQSALALLADQSEINFIRNANLKLKLQKQQASRGGRAAAAIAAVGGNATTAFQVSQESIDSMIDPIFKQRRQMGDKNANLLQRGGVRVMDEDGNPLPLSDPRAVIGGFSSARAYKDHLDKIRFNEFSNASDFFAVLGGRPMVDRGNRVGSMQRSINSMRSTQSLMQRTGFSLSPFRSVGSFARWGRGQNGNPWEMLVGMQHSYLKNAAISNRLTTAKAAQVDVLIGGFGLDQFFGGGGLSVGGLTDKVAEQDALISSIGLSRTTAFQIIDDPRRGREEIDERVRYSQRLESISSGDSVL